MMNIKIFA